MTPYRTRFIPIVLFSLFMLGCVDTFTGELRIHSAVELTGEENEKVMLDPGTYPTKLRFNENASVFEFEIKDASEHIRILFFNVSKTIRVPEKSGSFSAGAAGNGQPYDLSGAVSSDTARTETVRDFEFCTVQRSITDCGGPPPEECRQVWRTHTGHQPVEYHFDQKIKRLTILLIAPDNRQEIAVFHGEAGQRWKTYTYRGPCLGEPL